MTSDQKAWLRSSLYAELDRQQNAANNHRKYFPADHSYKATATLLAEIYEESAQVIRSRLDALEAA